MSTTSIESLEPLIGRTNNIDCFEGYSYLEDSTIDFVFTSPPYNRKRNDKYSNYTDMTVVDPFAGVGTTQLLCKEFKDTYIGFELDPEYTKIANLRTEES